MNLIKDRAAIVGIGQSALCGMATETKALHTPVIISIYF